MSQSKSNVLCIAAIYTNHFLHQTKYHPRHTVISQQTARVASASQLAVIIIMFQK